MLSRDELIEQINSGCRIYCQDTAERADCLYMLDTLGFDASELYPVLGERLSKWPRYHFVGVSKQQVNCFSTDGGHPVISFSEIPTNIEVNDEEFSNALKELLSV